MRVKRKKSQNVLKIIPDPRILSGRFACLLLLAMLGCAGLSAQGVVGRVFSNVVLRVDTAAFSWTSHRTGAAPNDQLWFSFDEAEQVVDLYLYPLPWVDREAIRLLPGSDYSVLDSLAWENDTYLRTRLQFGNLLRGNAPVLRIRQERADAEPLILTINLLPVTRTRVSWHDPPEELFVGEEYSYTIEADPAANVQVSRAWQTDDPVHYQFSRQGGQLRLQVQPTQLGRHTLRIPLQLQRPFRDSLGVFRYELPALTQTFTVKPARLRFLNINEREIVLKNDERRQTVEIELEYDRRLSPEKTYRIEAQEAPGGFLVAELFTRRILANGKMLCWLRPYDYHRRQEGYLYIKDGDLPLFLTNVDIMPETTISSISLLHEGEDWKRSRDILPGERVGIRLEGQALHRANFHFPDLRQVVRDTLQSNEREQVFSATVPLDILERSIRIMNGNEDSGQRLQVKEYERARPLDFVDLRIAGTQYPLNKLDKLVFIPSSVDDIIIGLRPDLIDRGGLYGPQRLVVNIEIRDQRNRLVDQREYTNLLVCPKDSPREAFYREQRCQEGNLSVNSLVRTQIYNLEPWTTIRITVRHDRDKYGNNGFSRTAEFVLTETTTFDIDVSFPAGLVTKTLGETGFGSLGGISMAMIAQFSFYYNNKIARAKPYKFGAGFLALNAFNFNDSRSSRDIGLVVLGSLYPIRTSYSSRLSFPLYAGGGYFLSEKKWFLLLGPGIRVRL